MKKSVQINLATLYSGRARHAIDGSNRIMLPAGWRTDGAPTQFFVVVVSPDEHLLVCPPAVFEAFLADLRADTADKDEIPKLERELMERVEQVSLDGYGRLPLKSEFMARAGIEKQGEIVGRFSKFEIWACDKYEKSNPNRAQVSGPLSRKLTSL